MVFFVITVRLLAWRYVNIVEDQPVPKKLIAYSCEYGCRRNVLTSKKSMAEHELRCFHNPKTMSCATCENLCVDDEGSCDYRGDIHFTETTCMAGCDISKKLKTDCMEYEIAKRYDK